MRDSDISLEAALRVKSAELWLEVGQPLQAISELEKLPMAVQRHPWAMEVARSICEAVYSCRPAVPAETWPEAVNGKEETLVEPATTAEAAVEKSGLTADPATDTFAT